MIVKICYFLKSIKSAFILVPCNTLLSKNYVDHSYVTVVCVIGWIWEKLVCLRSLAVCAYEISRRTRIFPRFRIRQQSAYNIRRISNLVKTFEVRTLSKLNFVTSLITANSWNVMFDLHVHRSWLSSDHNSQPYKLVQYALNSFGM